NFRHRFSGFINTPVQKDEIEDPPIFDKNGEFLIPPKNTKPARANAPGRMPRKRKEGYNA
ncbi:hypothetical protein, partial [Treponema sp. R80B11-R83G3]